MDLIKALRDWLRPRPTTPARTPRFVSFEAPTWGHHVERFGDGRVTGHSRVRFDVGDTLVTRTGQLKVTAVRWMTDPTDRFFASVDRVGE